MDAEQKRKDSEADYRRDRVMAELINLRGVRKRNRRAQDAKRAEANRLAHGQSRHLQKRHDAERAKAERDLDRHRIEKGDGR